MLYVLNYYIRSCHVITCNTHQTWGLIYSRAMRTLSIECHMVVTSYVHWHVHAGEPATLCIHGTPGITYGRAVHAGQMIFIQINCLTFQHPKSGFCKPECAKKDSHCHAQ